MPQRPPQSASPSSSNVIRRQSGAVNAEFARREASRRLSGTTPRRAVSVSAQMTSPCGAHAEDHAVTARIEVAQPPRPLPSSLPPRWRGSPHRSTRQAGPPSHHPRPRPPHACSVRTESSPQPWRRPGRCARARCIGLGCSVPERRYTGQTGSVPCSESGRGSDGRSALHRDHRFR